MTQKIVLVGAWTRQSPDETKLPKKKKAQLEYGSGLITIARIIDDRNFQSLLGSKKAGVVSLPITS
jgi:hypothetical protein